MRITKLYDLDVQYDYKSKEKIKRKIKESLIEDVIGLAKAQFRDDEFKHFKIEVRLVPVKKLKEEPPEYD